MASRVVVIGAKGRFGRAAVRAFVDAGWQVGAFARNWPANGNGSGFEKIEGDAFDAEKLFVACEGADVIVNALNPPYERWTKELPRLTRSVLAAAKTSGATVMIPGNIYNYGANISPVITENTAHSPTTRKGRLRVEMERAYQDAAEDGVRTIVLRAGDFIEHKQTGNWFDSHIAVKAKEGKFIYPGPLNAKHAWAYLPDMANAMVNLAENRSELLPFDEFGFEGYSLTGNELVSAVQNVVGVEQKISTVPWLILRLVGLFSPRIREVVEMRYLWDLPHQIDGKKLAQTIPEFRPTPLELALKDALNVEN